MGRTLDNKKIMEHRKEFTSMPHSKPKRIRKAATPQDIVNGETIIFQYNLAGLVGLGLLWIAPSMAMVPTPVKIGFSLLYLISGCSCWVNKEE